MNSFLDAQKASAPEAAAKIYSDLQKTFSSRLYYQLNTKLLELVNNEHFQQNQNLIKLFDNFVSKFEKKGKAVDYARFCVAVSRQYADLNASLSFLEKLLAESFADEDEDSKLLLNMEIVQLKVKLGRTEECKAVLEKSHNHIEARAGVAEPVVSASYYQAAAAFHKVKGPAAAFFQNSMLYLAYMPLEQISHTDQVKLAVDVGLAALVGNNIYNFGELLQHAILNSLKGTEYAWLTELLFAFNAGNIKSYQAIAEEKAVTQDVLVKNAPFLNQKIRVMALMEMVFKRASDDRTLTFQEIAQTCMLPVGEVELLLIKAFSLKVVKGTIDQVEQVVRIKYVQPRVLDKPQLETLRDRTQKWSSSVYQTSLYVEENAREIIRKPL